MAYFGFIFNGSPYSGQNLETMYNLASAALRMNHRVFIYLGNDGVYAPLKNQKPYRESRTPREIIGDLLQKGAKIVCSSYDIGIRGIDSGKLFLDGVKTGDLADLSEEISKIDRLLVF